MKSATIRRHIAFYVTAAAVSIAALPTAGAGGKPAFEVYGFVRFDMMYSDSQTNFNLVPMWVKNEYDGSVKKDDSSVALHPRLTRAGMQFLGWELSETWKADVAIEIDFQNFAGNSESRQTPRMRLGFIRLHHANWQFMGGQHWDLISPLYPNINLNGVNWNIGNLGDRRPQFRVTFAPPLSDGGKVYFSGAIAQHGAVDMADVDKNSVPDGQDSAVPQLQGRFGVDKPIGDDVEVRIGVWGHYAEEEEFKTDTTQVKTQFESWSAGADLWMYVTERVRILGEFWTGENLADLRGGIGQSIIRDLGIGIRATGGWGELDYIPSDHVTLIAGYTIDNPNNDDLKNKNMRAKNHAGYGAVRWRPWAKSFMLTFEYMQFRTSYTGFDDVSVNNHVCVHTTYTF